jgi:hypothetical protein
MRVHCPDQILSEVPSKCPRNLRYLVIHTILSDTRHTWDSRAKHILGSRNQIWMSLQQGSSLSSPTEDTAMEIILSTFSDMVVNAERRVDRDLFLSGRGFVGFCEYWIGHCK